MSTDIKIQNVILPYNIDANFRSYSEFTARGKHYASAPFCYNPENNCHILKRLDIADFMTYFNCLQINRWKIYTNAKSFKLHLVIRGKMSVELFEIFKISSNVNLNRIGNLIFSSDEKKEIVIEIPDTDKLLMGFSITALEELEIYEGWYSAQVEESDINEVQLSLVTTTFKKREFIKKNICLLQSQILNEEKIKDHIFVHIIDNERGLNPEEFNSKNLKVYPNNNVGGAGGFTRGMLEAMALEKKPTHILLMDDDVLIMSESIFRTYFLLRIIKKEFSERFVSGAMFDYDIRERQYEDIGYVHKADASYGPLKPRFDMRQLFDIISNEIVNQEDLTNAYSGWWYCCIPVKNIEKNGLPLPVFVRGDDVEFSLRNNAKFITLNGICIWHVGFAGKFNASMELYQVHRNSLIISAAGGVCKDIDFIGRIKKLFWKEITKFAYSNAELLLDSVEDYLKGSDFLVNLNGEQSLKEHSAKNEKLIPLSAIENYNSSQDPYEYNSLGILSKIIYVITINGHLIPNFLLKNTPAVIAFDWFFVPYKNFRRKKLIAVNVNDKTGCIRNISRKKCFELIKRYRKIMKKYNKTHLETERKYREAFPEMITEKFWKEYLEI